MEFETDPDLPTPEQPSELELFAYLMVGDLLGPLMALVGRGRAMAQRGFDLLQTAEMLLRRVIYLKALRIELPAPASATPAGPAAARPDETTRKATKPDTPRFALIEAELADATRPKDPRPLLRPEDCPRISVMDENARPYIPPPEPEPRSVTRPDFETRYRHRAHALARAFTNLDGEAERLARWIARQKARHAERQSPLGLPPAPDDAEKAKSDPAWPVLSDIYLLADSVLHPDTS
ncbi:MAG TPA: hypothetical protein DDY28_08215 [Hyphomonas atlantica]|nr:hypothetical protein [Hyphomonas atlantica]